jgi:redox-sensing transcriptional repressor
MSEDISSTSDKVLQRMPAYIHYLRRLKEQGQTLVSATTMAEELGIYHTQVRKDLALTGVTGTPKVGHDVTSLINALESFLNWNVITEAFIVGVGHLGTALINNSGWQKSGIKIIAGFDVNPDIIGKSIREIEILPLEKLTNLTQRMHVKIGIITTPASEAQKIADMMVDAGILAIWNFAPINLHVPEHIIVENTEIYAGLAVLSQKLKKKLQE